VDAAIEALGRIGDEDVAHALLDCLLVPDEGTALLDNVFGTTIAATRRRAAVKALALMRGIRPDRPGDYEAIPLARLTAGKPLPLQERRSAEGEPATDPSASEQVLSDFTRYVETRFVGDTERATRAIAGRHGLTRTQAERVCERYKASQQTPAPSGGRESSTAIRRAPAERTRGGRQE
jgi:hypothetical protein